MTTHLAAVGAVVGTEAGAGTVGVGVEDTAEEVDLGAAGAVDSEGGAVEEATG